MMGAYQLGPSFTIGPRDFCGLAIGVLGTCADDYTGGSGSQQVHTHHRWLPNLSLAHQVGILVLQGLDLGQQLGH